VDVRPNWHEREDMPTNGQSRPAWEPRYSSSRRPSVSRLVPTGQQWGYKIKT
jgi:hypothetical protein